MAVMAILRWRAAGSTPAWCARMKRTLARKAFKQSLGQANHFLVTTLIALDCLDSNKDHQALGLHAAWSPKSVSTSVSRSRIFVMHSFLGYAVDAIDVYFSLLNRTPDFIQDETFSKAIQGCGRSIYQKSLKFSDWVPDVEVEYALTEILITWRNNVMHELADNKLSDKAKNIISKHSDKIGRDYRGLDASGLEKKACSGDDLSFKETASLISASHKYVEKIDSFILKKLDKARLFEESLRIYLKDNSGNQGFRTRFFDLDSARWPVFISNWAGNQFGSPSLSVIDLDSIRKIAPNLK